MKPKIVHVGPLAVRTGRGIRRTCKCCGEIRLSPIERAANLAVGLSLAAVEATDEGVLVRLVPNPEEMLS